MADFILSQPGKDEIKGTLHPEIADQSLEALRRDLGIMRRHNCSYFVRKPYEDIDEIESIKAMKTGLALNSSVPADIKAICVFNLVPNETNVRLPIDQEALDRLLATDGVFNFYSRQPGKGFA